MNPHIRLIRVRHTSDLETSIYKLLPGELVRLALIIVGGEEGGDHDEVRRSMAQFAAVLKDRCDRALPALLETAQFWARIATGLGTLAHQQRNQGWFPISIVRSQTFLAEETTACANAATDVARLVEELSRQVERALALWDWIAGATRGVPGDRAELSVDDAKAEQQTWRELSVLVKRGAPAVADGLSNLRTAPPPVLPPACSECKHVLLFWQLSDGQQCTLCMSSLSEASSTMMRRPR